MDHSGPNCTMMMPKLGKARDAGRFTRKVWGRFGLGSLHGPPLKLMNATVLMIDYCDLFMTRVGRSP